MDEFSLLQLLVSVVIVVVAVVTAAISFINLKAALEVTLYLQAETKLQSIGPSNNTIYPYRILNSFALNGINMPLAFTIPFRYFDLNLGNTGPGTAFVESWSVDYDVKAPDMPEMKSDYSFVLGPQSKLTLVGFLARDFSLGTPAVSYTRFNKLPNSTGRFPWKVQIVYSKKSITKRMIQYSINFEVNEAGLVRASGPTLAKE